MSSYATARGFRVGAAVEAVGRAAGDEAQAAQSLAKAVSDNPNKLSPNDTSLGQASTVATAIGDTLNYAGGGLTGGSIAVGAMSAPTRAVSGMGVALSVTSGPSNVLGTANLAVGIAGDGAKATDSYNKALESPTQKNIDQFNSDYNELSAGLGGASAFMAYGLATAGTAALTLGGLANIGSLGALGYWASKEIYKLFNKAIDAVKDAFKVLSDDEPLSPDAKAAMEKVNEEFRKNMDELEKEGKDLAEKVKLQIEKDKQNASNPSAACLYVSPGTEKMPFDQFLAEMGISPLVLDLDGNGIDLISIRDSHTFFDMKNDGFSRLTGWTSGKDGLLALDHDKNGRIDNASELFGGTRDDGFASLRKYDGNSDGVIDSNDMIFNDLIVWVDIDKDGISQNTEMHSLSELGISQIGAIGLSVSEILEGNEVTSRSNFVYSDGRVSSVADVWFTTSNLHTKYKVPYDFEISDTAKFLPNLKGYGLMKDLRIQGTIDPEIPALTQSILNYINIVDLNGLNNSIDDFLYKWAGVDSTDPSSRGLEIDARKLAVVEAFYNQKLVLRDKFGNQLPANAPIGPEVAFEITYAYNRIKDVTKAELIVTAANEYTENSHIRFMDVARSYFHDDSTGNIIGLPVILMQNIIGSYNGMTSNPTVAIEIYELIKLGMASSYTYEGQRDFLESIHRIANTYESDSDIVMMVDQIASSLISASEHRSVLQDLHSGINIGSPGLGIFTNGGNEPNDLYMYIYGSGNSIIDDGNLTNVGGNHDGLVLLGVNKSDVSIRMDGYDIILEIAKSSIPGVNDVIVIKDQGLVSQYGKEEVESYIFQDGAWTTDELRKEYINRQSTLGNDDIFGSIHDDHIFLGKGNDIIRPLTGNDVFIYKKGDGNDIIYSTERFSPRGENELVLADIERDAVRFYTNGRDIKIIILDRNDGSQIGSINLLSNPIYFDEPSVGMIKFSDGSSLDILDAYVLARAAQITDGNDEITGTAGADIMRGGKGDDHLAGGTGVDTYVYARGDGNDIVDDGLVFENNNLVLHDITVSEMKVAFVGYDVVISFAESTAGAGDAGSIRFRADDYWHAHALGMITFDDGTVLNTSQWTGIGYDQANVFHPGDGDRTVKVNFTDGAVHAFLLHGYTPDQVSVTGVDYLGQITLSMVNATAGTTEAIHLINPPWEKGVDQIQFDNGAVWTRDDLRYKAYVDDGTHGSTVTLDTAIYANQSAFVGGTGDTIYIVDAGLQPVSIADHGGTNALTLRGVSQAQVDFSVDAQTDALVMAIHDVPGRNDSVVKFAHGLDTKGVAAVHFDDGSMTAAEIQTWIDTHHLAA